MMLENVRILTDWAKDATHGVNAQLAALEAAGLFDGDPTPADIAFIGDPTRDGRVARLEDPVKYPALYILPDGPVVGSEGIEVASKQRRLDSSAVSARLIIKRANAEDAGTDVYHTLRAIVRSWRELFKNANKASRVRNGVYLEHTTRLEFGPWSEPIGANSLAVGVVAIDGRVIDQYPNV